MKTLSQYIEDYKFDYVNDNITEVKFPQPEKLRTDFKIFDFKKPISTEDVISEMKKESYAPADIYETLEYSEWNGKDTLVSLGSVCLGGGGGQCAPVLGGWDGGRGLGLFPLAGDWLRRYRFPAVRESDEKILNK